MVASPSSHAQSGPYPNIIQLNVAGGGYLGIQMDDVTAANMSKFKLTAEKGVIVRSVVKGAPAEKAGLHEEDVILEYAGTQVWSSMQFTRLVQETPPGRKVGLGVSRAGKRVSLTAEIGKRDEGRADNRYRELLRMFPERPLDRRETLVVPAEPSGKPRLGLTLQPLSDQLAQYMGAPGKKGVLVASVLEGSPAAGKIRAGDVNDVVSRLREIPTVSEAHMTFGPYDAVAVIDSSDLSSIGALIATSIQPISGVEQTLTCLAADI